MIKPRQPKEKDDKVVAPPQEQPLTERKDDKVVVPPPQTLTQRAVGMTKEVLRLWEVWIVTIVMFVIVYYVAPQQIAISAYKASMITSGALIGYWVDRWSFGRIFSTDDTDEKVPGMLRRAGLIAAGMLAFGLGA